MLPPEFKKYFWDVDFETLDLVKRWKFILSRLMEIGGLDAARWISQSIASKMMRIMGLIRDGMIFSVALPVKHARVDRLERNSAETIQILVMTRHSNSAWGKEILKM